MTTKAYVVSRGSFSYDDNYYSNTEGVHPNKVFLTEDQAQEYADELGLKDFKDLVLEDDIFNYGYGDLEGCFILSEEFEEFIQEKFKMSADDWWSKSRKYKPSSTTATDNGDEEIEFSDEDWTKFYSFCTLGLAEYHEVEFGDVFS